MKKLIAAATLAFTLASGAQAADLVGNFEFSGNYANSQGGQALTGNGGTFEGTGDTAGLRFGANEGPSFAGGLGSNYAIELYFSLDAVSGYKKIVDFLNRGSDTGLYVNGGLNFYPLVSGGALTAGQLAHVVFNRAADGSAAAFLNGTQVLSFNDLDGLANNNLFFFRDDAATGGEASSGFVDFVRLYNGALTQDEITSRYSGGTPLRFAASTGVPEPTTWAMFIGGFGMVGGAMRSRRKQKTSVTYA